MKWKSYLTLAVVLFAWNAAFAQQRPVTNYTPDSEILALPSAMVTDVYQDRQGFIWLAVYSSGLVRFDGARMILFDSDDGLRDPGIWQIAEDHNGYLWIASHEGLAVSEQPLTAYQYGNRVTFTSNPNNTPLINDALTQNRITVDTSGRLWVGTSGNGLVRYFIDDNGVVYADTISTAISSSEDLSVNSVHSGKNNSVIVGLEGGILYRFHDHESELIFLPDEIYGGTEIISIYEDENDIWAYRQNGEILKFSSDSTEPTIVYTGPSSNINGLHLLSDGSLWASNGAGGIARFNRSTGEVIEQYSRATGLLSENVFHVMEDREGNVWIAQSGGISKLRYNYRAFENYSSLSIAGEAPALPSPRINTILVPDDDASPCRIWVGTEGGATCINKDGNSVYLTQADGLAGNWVNGLSMGSSGRIWIATTQGLNGIAYSENDIVAGAINRNNITINGQQVWVFTIPNSPPFIAAENILIRNSVNNQMIETSWFPGLRSIFGVVNGNIYELNSSHGLPATLYKSVALDEAGYMWIGTLDRGIYKSSVPVDTSLLQNLATSEPDPTLFSMFWSRDNGAPTNHIEKLVWHQDSMWIGTQEGLYVIDPETTEILKHISRADGLLADNTVSFALSPTTGHFWAGTNRGLAEINPQDGSVLKNVTRQDGLIDNEVWLYGSVKVDKNGIVYYGTASGLSVYHPDLDRPNTTPPLLHLISFDLSYQAEGRNEVVFEYAATSFGNTSQVRYRTRLIGYNENWSPETQDVSLRYTNLPALLFPKTYTFEVIAVNESGVASEIPLRFSFSVNPVWWLTWWAFMIYIAFFGLVIFTVDRMQRNRLIKKERDAARLREAELRAETATARSKAAEAQAKALEAENERKALELEKARELEIAYHNLQSAQKQLIQAEKMASLGRLSTGIAHEIKNPLNFINNFAGVSNELVDELVAAIEANDKEEMDFLLENLKHNTIKIEEHGKRADSIVKSMMQHARGGKAEFGVFNINSLVEKYVNLAFHGKKSQIPDFHANIHTKLDPNVKEAKVVGQEIGQALLNIIGNSLDAVWDFRKKNNGDFEPEVKVTTYKHEDFIEIRISDNGPGVPEEIKEKIFEPFFTTKPTGEGTGLGLSLSYDIITQGHNGSLVLESKSGEGATFIITLPVIERRTVTSPI